MMEVLCRDTVVVLGRDRSVHGGCVQQSRLLRCWGSRLRCDAWSLLVGGLMAHKHAKDLALSADLYVKWEYHAEAKYGENFCDHYHIMSTGSDDVDVLIELPQSKEMDQKVGAIASKIDELIALSERKKAH
jgi:hypothetical protein